MVIDGKQIAGEIAERLKALPAPKKFFAAVLVGDDKNSISFLAQKKKMAESVGIDFRLYPFPAEIKNDALRAAVGEIAAHKTCGGVLVQLPLPAHVNRHYILNAIPPQKDVDVLGERSLGAFYVGRGKVVSPVAATVEEIVRRCGLDLAHLRVAVVGRGILVGRPIATWLMGKVRELSVFGPHAALAGLEDTDLVITGIGKANFIKPEMLKSGATVIDFGYDSVDGKLYGDLDTRGADTLGFFTPTPGGTGPVVVAKLFENFYTLNG